MGSDTAISTKMNEKFYRLSNNGKKLWIIKDKLIFCSGEMNLSYKIIESFNNSNDKSINYLKTIAEYYYNKYQSKDSDISLDIIVGIVEDNQSIIYQISPYNNFNIIKKQVNYGEIGLWVGGIKTNECYNYAYKEIQNQKTLKQVYQNTFDCISSEEVGGDLLIYKINSRSSIDKVYHSKINEKSIKLLNSKNKEKHLIIGDRIIGRIFLGENLYIENEAGTFEVDNKGLKVEDLDLTITNSDNNTELIMNDEKVIEINSNGEQKFYIDENGNIKFKGSLEGADGTFTGTLEGGSIIGGSINIGDSDFQVDSEGNLTAYSGYFEGDIEASNISISGAGGMFYVYDSGYMMAQGATFEGDIEASNIDADSTISGSEIIGAIITGSTLRTSSSGQRVEIQDNKLSGRDENGTSRIEFYPTDDHDVNYYELRFYDQDGSHEGTISGADGQMNLLGHSRLVIGNIGTDHYCWGVWDFTNVDEVKGIYAKFK